MSDYSIGELIEIYTAHYSNYKGVNDQKRAMCQTFLKDLRIVNKRIKQLEDAIIFIQKWVDSKSNNHDKNMAISQMCEKALEGK